MRVEFVGYHGVPSFTLFPESPSDYGILAIAADFSRYHPDYDFRIHSHSYSEGKVLSLHFGYGKKETPKPPEPPPDRTRREGEMPTPPPSAVSDLLDIAKAGLK